MKAFSGKFTPILWLPIVLVLTAVLFTVFRYSSRLPALPTYCEMRSWQVQLFSMAYSSQLASMLDASMVQVPAGTFMMGSDAGSPDAQPQHDVTLDAFAIDCFEVTNAQYLRFLEANNGTPPSYWNGMNYPVAQADFPVVGMSWADADAYCTWAGERLPTEAEWEKAARGTDGRTYPWGNEWDSSRANVFMGNLSPLTSLGLDAQLAWDLAWEFLRNSPPLPGEPSLAAVGSRPAGQSPYGVMDAVGNVSEWAADYYNWADYSALPVINPFVDAPPYNHVVRGSAWYDPTGNAKWQMLLSRTFARNSSHVDHDPRIGFRCAKSTDGS